MSWSLGEARTLATKAARGAGFHWGLAEEAGFAVHWLQSQGAPGAEALAHLLTWMDKSGDELSSAWMFDRDGDPAVTFNPIELGAASMDSNRYDQYTLARVCLPLLLAPFVAAIAPDSGCRLRWNDCSIHLGRDCFHTTATRDMLLTEAASCILSATDGSVLPSARHRRVMDTEVAAMASLTTFAARTYAPATEESRLAGAGAGLTDND